MPQDRYPYDDPRHPGHFGDEAYPGEYGPYRGDHVGDPSRRRTGDLRGGEGYPFDPRIAALSGYPGLFQGDWMRAPHRRGPMRGRYGGAHERDFFDKASDEVSSWFGDEEAEQRRDADHRGKGPRGYRRSDERITEEINQRLTDDAHIDASDIEVSVSEGEATLTGEVDSRRAKRLAEDCAEHASGVRDVHNRLTLRKREDPATAP